MANELRHADAISGRVRENEYEHPSEHILNDQATGDLVYASSATQLSGKPIGSTGQFLRVTGGVPTWETFGAATIGLADDILLTFGDDDDVVMVNRSTALNANTVLANVLVGTPVTQAVPANSMMMSNVTASGDYNIYVNKGGHSIQMFWADGSTGDVALLAASGQSIDGYIGGSKVFDISNDGTVATILGLAGDYWRVGDAGSTAHGLNSEDDLMVSGDFEILGTFHPNAMTLGGTVTLNGQVFDAGVGHILVSTTGSGKGLFITSTQDGATGAVIIGYQDSANPANDDVVFRVIGAGEDDASGLQFYGNLQFQIEDVQSGSNTGKLQITLRNNGGDNTVLTLSGPGALNVDSVLQAGAAMAATVAYNRFGAVATSHSLASDDDVMVSGKLEVDGISFFDAKVTIGSNLSVTGDATVTTMNSMFNNAGPWVDTDNTTRYGQQTGAYLRKTSAAFTGRLHGMWTTANVDGSNTQNWSNTLGAIVNFSQFLIRTGASGTITGAAGVYTDANIQAGTLINWYGLYVENATGTPGTLTNAYGLYFVPQTGGATANFEIASSGIIRISTNGDLDDYLSIETLSNVPTIKGVGAYTRFGDAAFTAFALASEDDVMITGILEANEGIRVKDQRGIRFGLGNDARIVYQINDSNARILAFIIDESADSGNNIPAFVFGEQTNLINADTGLFDAFVEARVVTLNNAGTAYSSLGPALTLWEQASAPNEADVAGLGQIWFRDDVPNNPMVTDDTGVDRQVMTADYGGLMVDLNSTAVTINLVDSYEQVVIFDTDLPEAISNGANATDNIVVGATGDYEIKFCLAAIPAGTNKTFEFVVFEIAASGSTITGVTQATPGVVTAVAHGFSTGNHIKITGVVGMTELNGRIFKITKLTDDTFSLQDEEGVDIATGGFTAYSSGGTATLSIRLPAIQSHRKFAAGDLGAMPGCGLASLTKGKAIELWVKNTTDTTNITVEHCSFYLNRMA